MFTDQALKKVSQLCKVFAKKDERYKIKLRSWEDFKKFPISGRQDLKFFLDGNVIENAFNIASTSGSTSSRLLIAHSREAYEAHKKRLVKLYRAVGIKKGTLCLNLCSYELNSGGRLMEAALRAAGAGVIPLGPISTPKKVVEAAHVIRKLKPTVVNAYTNQIFDLFSVMGRKHAIDKCLVSGELLWPDYRRRIEKIGGISVHDHYGVMEFSGLAVAPGAKDEYMKVFPKGLLLEVLDSSGSVKKTGIGDLIITDLDNYCMPFIRYHQGDRVELISRNSALWIKIIGRTEDSLQVNGVVAMKKELILTVNDYIGHPKFFFILKKDPIHYTDKLIINVVEPFSKDLQLLPRTVAKSLGLDNCIMVRKHKGSIPRTTNGKIKYFVIKKNE